MTQPGDETPGIGGVPPLPRPSKRIGASWLHLMRAIHVETPRHLRRSKAMRQRLLRGR